MDVLEYVDRQGQNLFAAWFNGLDAAAAARVTTSITRLSLGNISNVKGAGAGVFETKFDFGPSYRVYFGKDGGTILTLLAGGTKQRQQHDIAAARERWQDYKGRKKGKV